MGVLWLVFACWASCEVDELSSKGLASGREFDFADGCGGSGDILASSSNRDALFFAAGVFFSSAELAGSFAGLLAGFERFPELMLMFCNCAHAMTSMGVVSSAGGQRVRAHHTVQRAPMYRPSACAEKCEENPPSANCFPIRT